MLVADALKHRHPGIVVEIKIIKTTGDVNQSPIPLNTVGKSWFTGEIEQALLKGEIDLAVHSLKDISLTPVAGLQTVTVLERADPRDVLISRAGASCPRLADLSSGAIIGTDSVRRKMLILEQRPDLVVKSIRGNVDSRIKKMHAEAPAEHYDALVLAAAGLERLGILDVATEFFDPTFFVPVSGQGVLAAQIRDGKISAGAGVEGVDRAELLDLIHSIQHMPTHIAAEAELAFSRTIGGGCKMPIGCYAQVTGVEDTIVGAKGDTSVIATSATITIHAVMENPDTHRVLRKTISGKASDAIQLAEELARNFL
jgi:hydroxymethylbilane synthase